MIPTPAILGGAEVLILLLAVIPAALLVAAGMVVGLILLVRQSVSTNRRLQALEQAVAQIRDR